MAVWQFRMFGSPELRLNNDPQRFESRKALALLAYLAVQKRPCTRDSLATLLWPDSDNSKAKSSLRYTLSIIRKRVGNELLTADRQTITLNGEQLACDLWQFEEQSDQTPAHWETAVQLYQDDFLGEFTLKDSDIFDEWQQQIRADMRRRFVELLTKLVQQAQQEQRPLHAIPYAQRWLQLDLLDESAHRALMALYAQSGQRTAALQQYEQCRAVLDEELGIDPDQQTRDLHQQILQEQITIITPPPAVVKPIPQPVETTTKTVTGEPQATPSPLKIKPNKTFYGREKELAELQELVLQQPLITILGIGGIGKTAFVTEVGYQLADQFDDGVIFVSLAPLSATTEVPAVIGEQLGLEFGDGRDPVDQLIQALQQRHSLLILDNLEHLLADKKIPKLLNRILADAPNISIVATSRERLRLQQETIYPLKGLSETNETAAINLFIEAAQQAHPAFAPNPEDLAEIKAICTAVQGLPLAIRLAGSLISMLSLADLRAEIGRNADVLTSDLHDVQDRHRSIRTVFSSSWQRLDPMAKLLLSRLSVCRGTFDLPIATAVAQANVKTLNQLVSHSLIQRTRQVGNERYHLHPLIRQYAKEQLDDSEEAQKQQKTHAYYFTKRLSQHLEEWHEHYDESTLDKIAELGEDIRAAWEWHLAQNNPTATAVDPLLRNLSQFYALRGRHPEMIDLLETTLRRLPHSSANDPMPQAEWIRLTADAYFALGEKTKAQQKLSAALTLLGEPLPTTPFGWKTSIATGFTRVNWLKPKPAPADQQDQYRTLAKLYYRFLISHYFENDTDKTAYGALFGYLNALHLDQPAAETAVAQSVLYGLWRYMGRIKQAEQIRKEALATVNEMNDLTVKGIVYGTISAWDIGIRPWPEIKSLFKQAAETLDRAKQHQTRDDWNTGLTHLYSLHGNWHEFLQGNVQVYDGGIASQNHEHIGWSDIGRAMTALYRGDIDQCIRRFLALLKLHQQYNLSTLTVLMAHAHLAHAYTLQKNWSEARDQITFATRHFAEQTQDISYAVVDPYTVLAAAHCNYWEHLAESGSDTTEVEQNNKLLLKRFGRFAKIHPIGLPGLRYAQGWHAFLNGNKRRAVTHWDDGLAQAKTQQMPYSEFRIRALRHRLLGDYAEKTADQARIAEIEQELRMLDIPWDDNPTAY